jgi:hypothetical protein
MTATDKRVEDLLDRWLASVELHLRYLKLDDAAYARAEAWPKHQRPNALVVNLARTRLLELKVHLSERRDAGDAKFAESLELMSFLTSLLGAEHIERFVPLATGKPRDAGTSGTVEQPRIRSVARAAAEQKARSGHHAQVASKQAPAGTAPKSSTGSHKRPTRPAGSAAGAAGTAGAAPRAGRDTVSQQLVGARPRAGSALTPAAEAVARPQPAPASRPPPRDAMTQQVIADAIRMLEWGREWPALAGLIGRMADRPPEAEIWKILRTYRNDILAKSRRTG